MKDFIKKIIKQLNNYATDIAKLQDKITRFMKKMMAERRIG